MLIAKTMMCANDAMMMKHEAMGTIWSAGQIQHHQHHGCCHIGVGIEEGQGEGALGGRVGGVLHTLLMVELGSWGNVHACMHNNSSKKCGTPIMKISV